MFSAHTIPKTSSLCFLSSPAPMDPNPIPTQVVLHDFPPMFQVTQDGRVHRPINTPFVPPSADPTTGVQSKDVVISTDPNKVTARLYLPKSPATTTDNGHHKLPVLIYIHGGGFVIESAFSTLYHNHINSLSAAADAIVVSVEYRRAPEHPVPACYEDSWAALKLVEQRSDPWLQDHADLGRVFFAGDSAGANIAHNTVVRAGTEGLGSGITIVGMILIHPYFGMENQPEKLWNFCCPETSGLNDPRFYPNADPGLLAKIGCGKVLVCIAGKDFLKERGWGYYESLKKSEWGGDLEIMESEDEPHVFHLFKPSCERAGILLNLMASFIQAP